MPRVPQVPSLTPQFQGWHEAATTTSRDSGANPQTPNHNACVVQGVIPKALWGNWPSFDGSTAPSSASGDRDGWDGTHITRVGRRCWHPAPLQHSPGEGWGCPTTASWFPLGDKAALARPQEMKEQRYPPGLVATATPHPARRWQCDAIRQWVCHHGVVMAVTRSDARARTRRCHSPASQHPQLLLLPPLPWGSHTSSSASPLTLTSAASAFCFWGLTGGTR